MRTKIFNPEVSLMKYGIREIVDVAQRIKELNPDQEFTWENIGDPIAKGWPVPEYLKELIINEVQKTGDHAFGYTHSRGTPNTRKWVVEYAKKFSPSSNLDYEYVLFTSGLGAAISAMYHMLPKGARIIQPTPSYPTHASMESFAAGADPITYNLDPFNNWEPDLDHLEDQIKKHPEVVGILIINPNNPTGAVYSQETVARMVQLAEQYKLMLISDEVYFRMVFNGHTYTQVTEIAHDRVPLVVMRGLSKDIPWPGGRCGWLEFHNVHLDEEYKNYCESVKKRVLMEVCSVTLPQVILPSIYEHPEFAAWNKHYNQELEATGNMIADILSQVKGLRVNRTNGAFYMMPLFEEGVLKPHQTLPIENENVRTFIESQVAKPNLPLDQRFTYYILAATGIVIVPASGFFSPYHGFRITTLDRDPIRRKETYTRLAKAIEEYLVS
jgi:aspartate/methionine/tyrosine aminotransferase